MSDVDMSGDEEYEFEYSDEDSGEEEEPSVVNDYLSAKEMIESDPHEALAGFQRVIDGEPDKGEWGFKARKQRVKLFFTLGNDAEMLNEYRELLSYMNVRTRNESEKVLNNVLQFVSGGNRPDVLLRIYETTLEALKEQHNERLHFNTTLQLGKLCFERRDFAKLQKVLRELHAFCEHPDGTLNERKDTQLLEVYALEIQLYTEQKNHKKLMNLYHKSLQVRSAIPHPKIMGIIRECGGKMHMSERQWSDAFTDFFEAFKAYDEAGEPRRIQCLKYLVLASLLGTSGINPFSSQEAQPYKNDPEIVAMTDLVRAYERDDVREFERILKHNRETIMDDSFIRDYIEDLLRNIRSQVLVKLIRPYTRIRISFISQELNIPHNDVEDLMVSLILDSRIDGHIDQINGLLVLASKSDESRKYRAIETWATKLSSIARSVSEKVTAH